MKRFTRKGSLSIRTVAVFLAILLVALSCAGCSGSKNDPTTQNPSPTESESVTNSKSAEKNPTEDLDAIFKGRDDISYVMIYNPNIHYEKADNNPTVNTGTLSKWIDVSAVRADAQQKDRPYTPVSQGSFSEELAGMKIDKTGNRAAKPQPVFKEGDTAQYYYEDNIGTKQGTFTCEYVGDNCCFWVLNSEKTGNKSYMETLAKEFDSKIYPADVETFGTPRYADENGKIHFLFHPMEDQVLGYFKPIDLFTSDEVSDEEAKKYGANRDLALIHVNSLFLLAEPYKDMVCATLAHEFQHLINFSDGFENGKYASSSTWINESMSGYIEEKLYPGEKEMAGHYEAFAASDLIRHGQSMYNFDTTYDDIGVYGSVFLYSQYLENIAGESVFKSFHQYWRTTFDENQLFDENALYSSIPERERKTIADKYVFPDTLHFDDEYCEFMSKLTLDFYISLLKFDPDDPAAYKNVVAQTLLYDEVNPADIEGGGRVIAATKDGHFEIPDNAGVPLVFVGFDKDMKQVTDLVVH